jgi:hypothetical protein
MKSPLTTQEFVSQYLTPRRSFWLGLLILLIAATLRTWGLTTIPSGLTEDEIDDLRIAETVRRGRIEVFYDLDDEGREGLYQSVLAASTIVFGSGSITYRMLSVWTGLLTLAMVYAVTIRLYGPLAAVAAMALLAVGMLPIILSRTIGREAFLSLLVSAVLLALALSLPVYQRYFNRTGNTTAFAALGALLGFGVYLHPVGLMVALFSMVFIAYMVFTRQPFSQRRRSYTSFAILLMIIVAMPYVISSLRRPDLAGAVRLFGSYEGILRSIGNGLAGIVFMGDSSAMYNLPGRPLIDLVSGLFVILGCITCVAHLKQPRFVLLAVATLTLLPPAFLTANTPQFGDYAALLPLLAMFFGVGVHIVVKNMRYPMRQIASWGLLALFVFNIVWVARDLFTIWPTLPETQTVYNSRIGQLAHHLDLTSATTPSVICARNLNEFGRSSEPSGAELIAQLMNRGDANLRYVNCERGLVFTNGGALQQVILPEVDTRETMPPYLQNWLLQGKVAADSQLPSDSVVLLDITQPLADTTGRFTTTTPISYAPEVRDSQLIAPPVTFGGNLTFLGYEQEQPGVYRPGAIVTVITYWRIDGHVPRDLVLFTHILADPGASPAAQTDTISADPRLLQNRDVLVQVTYVVLPFTIPEGTYRISVGAYQGIDKRRLDVLENGIARSNRIFLYPITVTR